MTASAVFPVSLQRRSVLDALGWAMGIVMPVAAALIYPVYMHQMQPAWAEVTRLVELPFIVCELVIIIAAQSHGYRDRIVFGLLPRDIKAASGLLLVGLTVGSVFLSRQPLYSLFLSLTTLVHLRFCAVIFFLLRRDAPTARDLERFQTLLVAGLAVLAVMTAGKFHFLPPDWSVPGGRIELGSALPGFISVRHFGSWTGAVAAGLLIALLYGETESRTADASFLLAAGLTCWSGTRAAVLSLAVVAVIFLISLRRWPSPRRIVKVAALSALALGLGILLAPENNADFLLYATGDAQNADVATGYRLGLWHGTLERWLTSPWFGLGSGSTFWEVYIGWSHTQPHNVVLQFLISWGLIGATGGLWILGRGIVATHRTGVDNAALRPLTATLYSLLFMSLFEGMLFYPRFILIIAIGLATLLAARSDGRTGAGR